jgi:hypothetical protein
MLLASSRISVGDGQLVPIPQYFLNFAWLSEKVWGGNRNHLKGLSAIQYRIFSIFIFLLSLHCLYGYDLFYSSLMAKCLTVVIP